MAQIIRDKTIIHQGLKVSSDAKGNVTVESEEEQPHPSLLLDEQEALRLLDALANLITA